jgi:hypothetical protein
VEKEEVETSPEEEVAKANAEEKAQNAKTLIDYIVEEEDVTAEDIERWKEAFGKVYATRFDEGENFIYRYLAYPEYKKIRSDLEKINNPQKAATLFDEMIVEKCLLYPKYTPELKATLKAGTISTLAEQIRVASNFLPDAVMYELINKL